MPPIPHHIPRTPLILSIWAGHVDHILLRIIEDLQRLQQISARGLSQTEQTTLDMAIERLDAITAPDFFDSFL